MPRPHPELERWKVTAVVAALVIVLVVPAYVLIERTSDTRQLVPAGEDTFVGGARCVTCHAEAYAQWRGSDHDRAMDVASDSTVLGDFDEATFASGNVRAKFFRRDGKFVVHTAGPMGVEQDFEIAYTFGVEPLQQYLIPFPGGRLQALSIAWDTIRKQWFYLYPNQEIRADDWLHWTRGAQNWNGMCAECHSTNLIKNYDPETKTFNTTWSDIDVNCEACHGPGSRHVAWAEVPPMARADEPNFALVIRTSDISSRQQVELCAPCHSRRRELGDYDHRRPDLMDNVVPSILEPHLYYADGQILDEVYVYGSFVQSKMYRNDVRCSDCHNVHSLKLHKQGNDLCLQCHDGEVYDSYDHHFHKEEQDGRPSDGHLCVKCHMPERPYMVVDWRADHSIRVPRPDLTLEIGTPNSCVQSGCHDDKPAQWAADHYQRWYGKARKPHYGTTLAAARAGDPTAGPALARLAGNSLAPDIVRATALSLLPAYAEEKVTSVFRSALSDVESLVRYAAVENLPPVSVEERVALLAPMLFDPVAAVRMSAAVQLAGTPVALLKDYQREALAEALDDYIASTSHSLDFAFAGHNLGNLYAQLGDYETAVTYYRDAIEIDDLFYPAKVNLAMIYNANGQDAQAERLLREVTRDYPQEFEAAYSLALLLAEMGRVEEAVPYMERAATGLPTRSRIYYNLGLMQQQLGNVAAAESSLTHALGQEPDNLDYLLALADHYIKRGQLQQALTLDERMIAAHPESTVGPAVKAQIEKMSTSLR